MVTIIEANMLTALEESDKKALLSLAGTDKIIVISDKKSSVSIETMQLFMGLKAKTEFIQLEDIKVGFGLGYQYGLFSAQYSKDKVRILTNNDYTGFIANNMTCIKSLSGSKKSTSTSKAQVKTAPKKAAKEKTQKATDEKPQKAVKTAEKPELKKEAGVKEPESKTSEDSKAVKNDTASGKKTRSRIKDLSASSIINRYPELASYKDKFDNLNNMFVEAVKKSTDPNISFKMQLQMVFASDSEEIWKVLKKDFAKLKLIADTL